MVGVSAWAGIESTSADGTAPTFPEASSSAGRGTAHGEASRDAADRRDPVPVRRLRRQARPIIGSLDAAGVLMQRHAREVLLGSALIILPGVAINLFAATLAFDRYETFSGSIISVPELVGGAKASTGIEEVLWFLGLLINSLAACLVGGYVAALVARRQTGLSISIRAGYRHLLRRLPALVMAWAIGHCWIVLGGWVLRSVSGGGLVVAVVFGSPVILVLITMTVVVAPAIIIERLGPIAGLRRAWRLARLGFGTLFGFTLASVIIGLVVQYGIAYLPRLVEQTGLITFGKFGWLIEGTAGQVGRLVSMPVVAVATALVYLEIRMNLEGIDLTLDADRAFRVRS